LHSANAGIRHATEISTGSSRSHSSDSPPMRIHSFRQHVEQRRMIASCTARLNSSGQVSRASKYAEDLVAVEREFVDAPYAHRGEHDDQQRGDTRRDDRTPPRCL
jgi:hypothetical protein